jgi:membrane fusion protein, multidrug efflux system
MSRRAMTRRRSGIVVAAGLAALAVLASFLLLRGEHAGKPADPPPTAHPPALAVPVTPVAKETVPVYLDYIGATDAIRTVTLQAQVTGFLVKRAVPDGAEVKDGELLYQIDPSSYQAALDQATAQAQRDAAALEYAKANRQRNFVLSKTGDTSIDTLQLATSTEHQNIATLAADQAAVETARINLDRTQIRAPFAGRLSLSQVFEGTLITSSGTTINTLVQLDPIYATFNPPDTDLPEIQKAYAKGPLEAEVVIPSDSSRHYRGKITFLDNTVSRSTGTITVRATIENPDHTLLPGQFVHVRVHISDQPDTLLVPQTAIGSSQLGKYVYVVGEGDKVEQHDVTLGPVYGPLIAVTKGLAEGQLVAVGNLLRIGPGMAVKPVAAASPAPGRS